jgi:hypothetical protein
MRSVLLTTARGYPRPVRLSPGLCLLICAGLGGCATPLNGAEPRGNASLATPAEASTPLSLVPDRDDGPAPLLPALARRERTGNPWADCYRSFEPSDDPAADLIRLTAACAARARMVAVTPLHVANQGQDDPPERLTFGALRKRCYRAFAVGAPSVIDLDIAIKDPQGSLVAGDLSRDRWPIVPPRGPLCAPKSQRYTIEIGVAEGRGEYLFQVWGSTEAEDEDDADARPE